MPRFYLTENGYLAWLQETCWIESTENFDFCSGECDTCFMMKYEHTTSIHQTLPPINPELGYFCFLVKEMMVQ